MGQKRAHVFLRSIHVNNVSRRHLCINTDINKCRTSIKYGCGGRNPKCKHCDVDEKEDARNSSLYVIRNLIGDASNLLGYPVCIFLYNPLLDFFNASLTSPV